MKKFFLALGVAASVAGVSDAGPFRRKAQTYCTGSACAQPQAVAQKQTVADTSTAQGAALVIVQRGFRHWGHPFGLYEGIGMASTEQGAIQNCCFWGKRQAIDIGTARMHNGMWVAVVRYR